MKYFLGLNLFVHDTAFYLLDENKKIVFGVEEEKVVKTRYHMSASYFALEYMLDRARINKSDIVGVGLTSSLEEYEKLFERHKKIYGDEMAARHEAAIRQIFIYRHNLINSMGLRNAEVIETPHHLAHAMSSFSTSPYNSAAVITLDGNGENETTAIFHASRNAIKKMTSVLRPHSIGWIWEEITKWLRFGRQGNEGKTMGLAAYGKPAYKEQFYNGFDTKLGKLPIFVMDCETGLFESPAMKEIYGWTINIHDVLGESAQYNSIPGQYQRDIAATLQEVTNETFLALAKYAKKITGEENLVLCGGVAMNSVANGIVQRSGMFKDVYIPPNAGDNGTGLGSALYVYNHINKRNQNKVNCKLPHTSCNYDNQEIEEALKKFNLPINKSDDIVKEAASEIMKGLIIGWHQGKLELGARALGNRSILALPFPLEMKDKVNLKVKFREYWRPFAPVIKDVAYNQWFKGNVRYVPYMTATHPFKDGIGEKVPAVLHEDGTGRVQTCSKNDNSRLYALLDEIEEHTSIPILLNTSFNIKGMPIVCSPEDAILCYLCTDIDVLVIGDYIIKKKEHKCDRVSLVRVSHASRFIEMTVRDGQYPVFIVDGLNKEENLLDELLSVTLDKQGISYKVISENDSVEKTKSVYIVNTHNNPFSEFNGKLKKKIELAYQLVERYQAVCYLLNLKGTSFVFNQLFSKKEWEGVIHKLEN